MKAGVAVVVGVGVGATVAATVGGGVGVAVGDAVASEVGDAVASEVGGGVREAGADTLQPIAINITAAAAKVGGLIRTPWRG